MTVDYAISHLDNVTETKTGVNINDAAILVGKLSTELGKPYVTKTSKSASFWFSEAEISMTVWGATVEDLRESYRQTTIPAMNPETNKAIQQTPKLAKVSGLTFTVENGTEYVTVRVHEQKTGKLAGRTIAEFLSGPDNSHDFTGFGFISPNGTLKVWKRFCRENGSVLPKIVKYVQAIEKVLGNPAKVGEFTELYATQSGNCARCGHKLTVPASLKRGLGPDCAKMMGV